MEQRFFSLSKNVSGEFRRYLVSAFAGNLALPIYSLFVPLLASRLGASLFEIGLVGGASNAVYSFLPYFTGRFSDRQSSRHFFIVSSFGLLVGVSISYALISNALDLIIARVFEGVGWAILWPAMDAAISRDVAPPMDSKKAFSIYNVSWSGAAAIGPLLGSALIFVASIRIAFLCTFFIMAAAFVLNLIPSLGSKNGSKIWTSQPAASGVSSDQAFIEPSAVERPLGSGFYGGALALAAVSSGVLFTFFAPYARSLGMSILLVGVITFAFGFGRFVFYILSTNERVRYAVLRQERRVRNMILALLLTAVPSLLVTLREPSGAAYLIAYGISGAGISVVFAIAQAGLISESPPGKSGLGAGLFESSIGAGACFGPIIGGAISGSSLSVPFIVPPIGFAIFAITLPLLLRRA